MSRFGRGAARPDPVRLAAHPPAAAHPKVGARLAAHRAGAAPLPPSHAITAARPRANQGMSSSCTAGSVAIFVFVALLMLGSPLPWVPSMRAIYRDTRAVARGALTPAGQPLPPLTDTGADIEDVWTALAAGVEAMIVNQTPDGRFYDLWTPIDVAGIPGAPPANVNDEPQAQDLQVESSTRLLLDVAANTIDPAVSDFSDIMAAAIASNCPIEATGFADSALEDLAADAVAGAPNESDPEGGGHAFWFSAYRTNAAGEREFLLENTWGDGWAANGAGWVSEAFCAKLWAMYIGHITVRAA